MKVRVSYTVEVTDEYRRGINNYYGKPGLATRKEVVSFLRDNGGTLDDDLVSNDAPWCEACNSWHAKPESREHHKELQCRAKFIPQKI